MAKIKLNTLKQTLKNHGLRQTIVAAEAGIDSGTLNKIANNKIPGSETTQNAIVIAINKLRNANLKVDDIF